MKKTNEQKIAEAEASTVFNDLAAILILTLIVVAVFGCSRPIGCPTTNSNYFRQGQNLKPVKVSKSWYKCPPQSRKNNQ